MNKYLLAINAACEFKKDLSLFKAAGFFVPFS